MAHIRIEQLSVVRSEATLLDRVDMVAPDAGRTVLLGPSGAGKTLLLRAMAGLEPVSAGRIWFDDREVTHLPGRDRDVAMIFAQGGLQPHMTVARNIGLPLLFRRRPTNGGAGQVIDLAKLDPNGVEIRAIE
jgi:ABC-type sugar transport system ATPase subunit